MNVTFMQFNKRVNSTKTPTTEDLAGGVKLKNVVLKESTNIDNPTLIIDGTSQNLYAYNYIYIHEWGRYYFIDTCDLRHANIFTVKCSLDDLATYKTQILGTTAYIKYSSSSYSEKIIDNRISRFTDVTFNSNDYESIFENPEDASAGSGGENVFFITVGGEYSQSAYDGGYNYYVFSESAWNDFCAMMCDSSFENDIKAFFADVDSALISCRRMPIKTSELTLGSVTGIRVGRANIPYPANTLTSRYIHKTINATIPTYKNNFQQWSPYVRLKLFIPFIGIVDLPTDLFKDDDVIIDYVVDLTNGQMDVHVCHKTTENIVCNFTTEIGGQLPTSVNNVNYAKVAANTASAVGLLAAKNVVGALEQAAEAVNAGISDNVGNKGSFGGGRSEVLETRFILYSIYWQPVFNLDNADFIATCGKPCHKVQSLSGLTGFCQTVDFSINLDANKAVIDSINSKLDAGIYIE